MGLRLNCRRTSGSRLTERNPLHMVAMMKAPKLNQMVGMLNMLKTETFFSFFLRLFSYCSSSK